MAAEIYYEVHGEGPPVVFAHGLGGNHASWFQQVPFFARFCRVVTFDHRGFGNSRVPGGADRSRFVEDLRKLLDHLGIAKAGLVAQSMGGGTCAHFAVRYPERVSALVLADTLGGFKLPESLQPRMDAVQRATTDLPQLERVLGPKFREEQFVFAHLYTEINSFNVGARENIRGAVGEGVTVQQLAATKIPILFLVGSVDILFPPDLVMAVHRLIPGSQYLEVPGAGHSVYFEIPNRFNEGVLAFLRACGVVRKED